MAKKFIDVFLQGYRPKDPAGQRFIKKHIVAKTPDANGNKDDVFDATNVKTFDREKNHYGYNHGDDAEMYEEVELDELSRKTLASYVIKAADRYNNLGWEDGFRPSDTPKEHVKKIRKLQKNKMYGISRAAHKMSGRKEYDAKVLAKEDVENLEELSRTTLSSYVKKAGGTHIDSVGSLMYSAARREATGSTKGAIGGEKLFKKAVKRGRAVMKAVDKLTDKHAVRVPASEEVEDVSEEILARHPEHKKAYVASIGKNVYKSSNRHGNVKYWNEHGKKSAYKHADCAMSEEVLDELSAATLGRYVNHAAASPLITHNMNTAKKRLVGISKATHQLTRRAEKAPASARKPEPKVIRFEDIEQVDELSKGKLGDYIKSASVDKSSSAENVGFVNGIAATTGTSAHDRKMRDEYNKIHARRSLGIQRAVDKLTKDGK